MSNELAKIDYSDNAMVRTLKETVAKNLTMAEFEIFRQYCMSTGLNPFKKEIWAIKAGNQLQLMTGINGFLQIANSHPKYDGMEVEINCDKDSKPIFATAKVYRKDRSKPSVGIAYFSEYQKSTPIWREKPRHMLAKVAKSIALREAFSQQLNGLYTEEEMPENFKMPTVTVKKSLGLPNPEEIGFEDDDMPFPAAKGENADKYVLEGKRKLKYTGKTLREIFDADPGWLQDAYTLEEKRAFLTEIDLLNIEAFYFESDPPGSE